MGKQVIMSSLYCEKCDNLMVIPRKKSKRREDGHLKHMWCFKCKEVTGHLEHVKARSNLMNETYVHTEVKALKRRGFDFVEDFKLYLKSIGMDESKYIDSGEKELINMVIASNTKLKMFEDYLMQSTR